MNENTCVYIIQSDQKTKSDQFLIETILIFNKKNQMIDDFLVKILEMLEIVILRHF